MLYEACVKGLRTINPDHVFNASLPRNNAAKVNACQEVVKTIIEAGFRGDLSYSALMYPNEGDTRNILMWLNQSVKTGVSVDDKKTSAKDVLSTAIALELKRQLSQSWTPLFFPSSSGAPFLAARPLETVPVRSAYIEGSISSRHAKQIEYICKYMPYACNQPPLASQVPASLLNAHAIGLAHQKEAFLQRSDQNPAQRRARVAQLVSSKLRVALTQAAGGNDFLLMRQHSASGKKGGLASRFIRLRNQLDKVDVVVKTEGGAPAISAEEQAKEAREKQLAVMEEELKRLAAQIQAGQQSLADLIAGKRQLDADAAAVAARTAELDKARSEIEMVRRLMQDPEGNKAKLLQITQANAARLLDGQQKWEPKRVALLEGYRAEKDKFENRKKAAQGLLHEIEEMRTKAKDLAADVQQKDQRYRNLLEEWKQLEKGKLRSSHTDKIEEGLKNVKKQNADIDKVKIELFFSLSFLIVLIILSGAFGYSRFEKGNCADD